ncbi:Alpha/Beta hydrolase protein [Dissophora ornata]|nr:Alpha/Beta hydrolase protein [Dissophora ornata]
MIALLDHLNIPKAVFIGHDWGASTCWSVGLFHPERCRAVISIGIPYMEPQVEYADPKDLQKVFPQFQYFAVFQTKEPEGWFDGNSHTMAVAMLNSVYGPSVGTSVEEKQLYIDSFTRTTMHGGLNYYRATRLSFEDGLPYVGKPYTVPAMLIIVESDPIVTPAFVASHTHGTIQSLEQARIKEGGHNVQTENPEEVNKLIDGYLAKVFDKKQGLGKQTIEE